MNPESLIATNALHPPRGVTRTTADAAPETASRLFDTAFPAYHFHKSSNGDRFVSTSADGSSYGATLISFAGFEGAGVGICAFHASYVVLTFYGSLFSPRFFPYLSVDLCVSL